MKKIFICMLICICSINLIAQDDYYWYKGEKIILKKKSSRKFILFDQIEDSTTLKSSLKMTDVKVEKFDKLNIASSINLYKSVQIKENKWAVIKSESLITLPDKKEILYEAPFYLTPEKKEVGLSNLFYVKLYKPEDIAILEKLALENNVDILGNDKYMPLWFTLSCTNKSKGNALQLANQFYETQFFSAAEPDLMADNLLSCVNDLLFHMQWGLKNTGQSGGTIGMDINYCPARQITEGSSEVIVAVIDRGVDKNHIDFANIHPISYDAEWGVSPSKFFGDHGTYCAGIIGASANNNNIVPFFSGGIAGIAPKCPIMVISHSFLLAPSKLRQVADAINFAANNGASVINNSWYAPARSQALDDAINNALTNGRGGLGCVVVFAAGNNNGAIEYPANSNDKILTVGAMSPCGERKSPTSCDAEQWGSSYGLELDVVAPGVSIPSTSNSPDYYTVSFSGTSAACPHVAGVAALVLSVNPYLTNVQVGKIIESTARKVGNYPYQVTSDRPNGLWCVDMGYGLVDAYAAVQACPLLKFTNQTVTTNRTVTGCYIDVQNVKVQGNIGLTLDAENTTNIIGQFETQLGSTLEIR